MRAILIDPYKGTITEEEISTDFHDILSLLQCDVLCAGPRFSQSSYSFVNDNGFLGEENAFFLTTMYSGPLAGRCVITGINGGGETTPCDITLADIKATTIFLPGDPK